MWNLLSSESTGGFAGWLSSWWDFSSFGPDAIIGIGTGLIVGSAVLWVEREVSARASGRAVEAAQRAAVEEARLLLESRFIFRGSNVANLKPVSNNLERLRTSISAVPPGEPLTRDIRFELADETLRAADKLEVIAEGLGALITDYGTTYRAIPFPLASDLVSDIQMAAEPLDRVGSEGHAIWSAVIYRVGMPEDLIDRIESDEELNDHVNRYLVQRGLLMAYRAAFIAADEKLGPALWAAERKDAERAAGPWWSRIGRARRRNHDLAQARVSAQRAADDAMKATYSPGL